MKNCYLLLLLFLTPPLIAQTNSSETTHQNTLMQYSFSFDKENFEAIQSELEFIKNVTQAESVVVVSEKQSVIVSTYRVLDSKVIYGKFEKKEISYIQFTAL